MVSSNRLPTFARASYDSSLSVVGVQPLSFHLPSSFSAT